MEVHFKKVTNSPVGDNLTDEMNMLLDDIEIIFEKSKIDRLAFRACHFLLNSLSGRF